ncbi:MAG: transposase [Candidatus Lokiarchaeota archaeon]|nr:transposase [Candidatus Harpocratesius repetitus]
MSQTHKNKRQNKKKSNFFQRYILDLKIKVLSLNEIQDHLRVCHNYNISIRSIRNILCDLGAKAKAVNRFYDNKVLPKIKIAEADEIYQGHNNMYIGIADKNSNYLVSLTQLNSKNTESFQKFFGQFSNNLSSLVVWMTDGLHTYNPVLNSTYPNITHIICHVHTYREVMKEQEVYNRKARWKYKNLKKMRENLKNAEKYLKNNQKTVNAAINSMNAIESERNQFYLKHGIKKYSKTKNLKHSGQNIKKNFKIFEHI